ncbi:MAG: winged helix-turn-helix transcriptional regulator [Paracoccaceae bacterium]|nr:winged helix-turn-helix transcriptional regulator [Paracoccaceae bacterium]
MSAHDPNLSPLFTALGDASRRAMLERLMQGPASVTELSHLSGFALPTVLRHLAVLTEAKLVASEKSGRSRIFRALPQHLAPATDWLSHQRRIWETRLDQLEAFLATQQGR